MQFESAFPSLTKVHAAPWQGEKNEDAEVADSRARRGLTQLLFTIPSGQDMIAFRSKLQPVVTCPAHEQVAGSVNPLTKLTSKSALGVPNHSTKLASIRVESVVMGKLASLMAMFPIQRPARRRWPRRPVRWSPAKAADRRWWECRPYHRARWRWGRYAS
jgi:hypothetical protein